MTTKRFILAGVLLLVLFSAGIYGTSMLSHQGDTVAIVEKDGQELYRFKLQDITDTQTYTIGEAGDENEITVSPDGICVSHADCPDQTCVQQGVRAHGPTPIVCLPHHLTIRFSDDSDALPDVTTGH